MKFRFYITDMTEGEVFGTNSPSTADEFRASPDHFVVDAEQGEWLSMSGSKAVKDIED